MEEYIYDQRYPQRIKDIYTKNDSDLCIKSQNNKKMKIDVPVVLPNLMQGYLALNEDKQIISIQDPYEMLQDKIEELEIRLAQLEEKTKKSTWFG